MDRFGIVCFKTPHDGLGSRKGGYKRHPVGNRGPADGVFIRARTLAQGRVDNQVNLPVFDIIHHIGTTFSDFQ